MDKVKLVQAAQQRVKDLEDELLTMRDTEGEYTFVEGQLHEARLWLDWVSKQGEA